MTPESVNRGRGRGVARTGRSSRPDGPDGADPRALAAEQAALRRVAVRVAGGAETVDVLEAIVAEAFELFPVDFTALLRYEPAGSATIVAVHHPPPGLAVGERAPHIPGGLVLQVFGSGRPARVDAYADLPGQVARMHELGITAGAAAPILVDAHLWGVLAAMTQLGSVPPGLEHHLSDFAELAATAVSSAQARDQLRELAEEQAAVRRVAELVAHGTGQAELFEAVVAEAAELIHGEATTLVRFGDGRSCTILATRNGPAPVGSAVEIAEDGMGVVAQILATGRSARWDRDDTGVDDGRTDSADGLGLGVGVPIILNDRLWGVLGVVGTGRQLPPDTERRLQQFTELVSAALANAESRAQLSASRARVVATADETRRRLQRDLHDGAQQRLVQSIISLTLARAALAEGRPAADHVEEALTHAQRANSDLRELVRGILPASLTHGGLRTGLESLVENIAVPVRLDVTAPRLRPDIETSAYFVVAEALTNVVKHAAAHSAEVSVHVVDGFLTIEVRDDGVGGADPTRGSGLTGLSDRVGAANGTLTVTGETGRGTLVRARMPVIGNEPAARTAAT